MKKVGIVLAVIGVLLILSGIAYILYGYFKPKEAGISILTTPAATVYINGIRVGKTPYNATRNSGDIVLRLDPDNLGKTLAPYGTKLTLSSGIKTIVQRQWGDTEDASSGQIVSFEKTGGSDASFSVISVPDSSQISLDGNVIGFAPVKVSTISPGSHQLIVSSNGYKDENLSINIVSGYKLTAIIKLAKVPKAQPTPTPLPQTVTMVEILSTPTGFLRVREKPDTASSEIAQVKPGDKFPFVSEDKGSGWFQIEYLAGQTGWVSNEFAQKVQGVATPSASPSI